MKSRGQNIPVLTDTGSELRKKALLNPAHVCAIHPTPTEQATHTGGGLIQPKFDEVKGGFPQPLELHNTILRGRGSRERSSERSRLFYCYHLSNHDFTLGLFFRKMINYKRKFEINIFW